MQRENDALKDQLKTIVTEAPKGTEEFSQGKDTIGISYTFKASEVDGYSKNVYDCTYEEHFTWNELFSCAAPRMIDECTEVAFQHAYDEFLENNSHWKEDDLYSKMTDEKEFRISQESFNLIKVQFKALGLISIGEKKRSAADRLTYWKLTPHGDYVMTKLLAIKKNT